MGNGFFSPFFLSVDIMLGKEALSVLTNLSRLMAKKWRNPFCTCETGLTVRPQSWSRYCTNIWSVELVYPVPCGTGRRTGNRVRVWDWWNKSCGRIVSHTPAQNSFISCPTSHLSPLLDHKTRACYTRSTDGGSLQRLAHGRRRQKKRRWRKYIGVKSWEFGVKAGSCQETGG